MDPSHNPVPSPTEPPRADPESGITMPLPPGAEGSFGGGLAPAVPGPVAPPVTPSAALPAFLPPTVPVEPSGAGSTPQPAAELSTPGAGSQPSPAAAFQASARSASGPAAADDGDLIEKEWVMKAKQIVDNSRTDPHRQTKELHALKADYMKKRYNKIIGEVDE